MSSLFEPTTFPTLSFFSGGPVAPTATLPYVDRLALFGHPSSSEVERVAELSKRTEGVETPLGRATVHDSGSVVTVSINLCNEHIFHSFSRAGKELSVGCSLPLSDTDLPIGREVVMQLLEAAKR